MPASERGMLEVLLEMNQSSSAMTARTNTRLVVKRGRTGVGGEEGDDEGREREKRRGGGAKRERVPVPVLEECKIGKYHIRGFNRLPIGSMFPVLEHTADEVEILMLFMR